MGEQQRTTDFWKGRFAPAAAHNAGAGEAMYRKCLRCGEQALEGSLSPHARWCDQRQQKKLTLAAFDSLRSAARRETLDLRAEVRRAAREAL